MRQRVELAGDQLDEGRLAAAVGAEQGGVLALLDAQAEIVQDPDLAADDTGAVELDQGDGEAGTTGEAATVMNAGACSRR